jgi:glutathione S-transferase
MSTSPELVLYYAPGACSQVVHIALEELGLNFSARALDLLAGQHKTPEYLAINPSGKVPTLVVAGTPLTEVLAIVRWLDAARPGVLIPDRGRDALAGAQDWSVLCWWSATVHPVFTRFRVPPAIIGDPAQFGAVVSHAAPLLGQFFAHAADVLGEKDWLLGSYSVADLFAAWVWSEATLAGFDTKAFPSIEKLRSRVHARPAAQRALAREHAALLRSH